MIDIETRRQVYLANRSALVAYATRILGSGETAEDIVQEAYLRFAPTNSDKGPYEQTLAYLYRIVRNLSFDLLKRQKIEARETQGEPPFWSIPGQVPTPEDIVVATDGVQHIIRILSELPVDVRVALEMHRFGGHTLEEIAARLNISTATAHRYIRTAIVRIAAAISSDA